MSQNSGQLKQFQFIQSFMKNIADHTNYHLFTIWPIYMDVNNCSMYNKKLYQRIITFWKQIRASNNKLLSKVTFTNELVKFIFFENMYQSQNVFDKYFIETLQSISLDVEKYNISWNHTEKKKFQINVTNFNRIIDYVVDESMLKTLKYEVINCTNKKRKKLDKMKRNINDLKVLFKNIDCFSTYLTKLVFRYDILRNKLLFSLWIKPFVSFNYWNIQSDEMYYRLKSLNEAYDWDRYVEIIFINKQYGLNLIQLTNNVVYYESINNMNKSKVTERKNKLLNDPKEANKLIMQTYQNPLIVCKECHQIMLPLHTHEKYSMVIDINIEYVVCKNCEKKYEFDQLKLATNIIYFLCGQCINTDGKKEVLILCPKCSKINYHSKSPRSSKGDSEFVIKHPLRKRRKTSA